MSRLVADSLEADWNARLRLLDQARNEYQRLRAADRWIVDDEQRRCVLALATESPRSGGGGNNSTYLNSIERATINADGSLGPFMIVTGVTLVTARSAHTSAVVGNYLYVIRGSNGPDLNSIERATINTDGSLGSFMTVPVTMVAKRIGLTSAVIGPYLYSVGGFGNGQLNSVERATINADGSLDTFVIVPGVSLAAARYDHASAVVGSYLYVVGGLNGTGAVNSVERATLSSDVL